MKKTFSISLLFVFFLIQNGFTPKFVDINLFNLSMNEDEIFKKITKKWPSFAITGGKHRN